MVKKLSFTLCVLYHKKGKIKIIPFLTMVDIEGDGFEKCFYNQPLNKVKEYDPPPTQPDHIQTIKVKSVFSIPMRIQDMAPKPISYHLITLPPVNSTDI